MGYLVSIVGNSGVGKTTLAERLAEQDGFFAAKEQLDQRPFQSAFAQDLERYALANQVDFLLYRAQQERQIRSKEGIGIQDGGLDLDYHLFTRLFHHMAYLKDKEFALCQRLYNAQRSSLPEPDLYVYLEAPLEVVAERYAARDRSMEIATLRDLQALHSYLVQWLGTLEPSKILTIDAGDKTFAEPDQLRVMAQSIRELLAGKDESLHLPG
jgi:deoxyadenosine/deoxycytidine kinase